MIYLFVIFTLVFIAIIEIFTILFQLTGLDKSKARFQVISILTGTGFTTKESEVITRSKIRRNIAQVIMIFGFTSTATIVTLLFGFVRNFSNMGIKDIFVAVGMFTAVYCLFMYSKIGKIIDKQIERIANNALFGRETNVIVIKDSYDNNVVLAQILIRIMPELMTDRTLEQTLISRRGLMILAIERGDEVITNITKDTVLLLDDDITIFGPLNEINEIFYKSIKQQENTEKKVQDE